MLKFDNRFLRTLPGDANPRNHARQVQGAFWSRVAPTSVAAPRLIAYSPEVAAALGLSDAQMHSSEMVNALSGNGMLPGMEPYATVYGGHQFGNWAGQLGDGRAIFLGEVIAPRLGGVEQRYELQLKGAGPTPYSRRADGRAVLRSSIREFLCSEAMHHLGVPTTRALSLVLTGDEVERDMFYDGNAAPEPGAIVCRTAPTFIRFGHFELPASRGEAALLKQLVDFTIANYFPHLAALPEAERVAAWFGEVCVSTAQLIAQWMRVGFVHGVMNTDNMSILGLTIDYGPYGWVDNFDPGWTPNTTDAGGKRYAFGRQPGVAQWNLARLGAALSTLDVSAEAMATALAKFESTYGTEIARVFSEKFGLYQWADAEGDLMDDAFMLMNDAEIDMTIFFRTLATASQVDEFAAAFYLPGQWTQSREKIAAWFARYTTLCTEQNPTPEQRAARIKRMNEANPKYVLRNYLAQQAIDAAHQGDTSKITELLDVMRYPYDEQPGREAFAQKRPDWARHKAGCSMLSCSS
ncbi:MAG: YdiU family protein [Rhizobacter sp.]|nr:YdiU family protein [Burkholderiales bacterium]